MIARLCRVGLIVKRLDWPRLGDTQFQPCLPHHPSARDGLKCDSGGPPTPRRGFYATFIPSLQPEAKREEEGQDVFIISVQLA